MNTKMPAYSALPRGRLLYRPVDDARYVVVRHDRTGELRVVEDGWSSESVAAGPFDPRDALRALRLANTSVPEGCELGPWQPGIALFEREKLPGHPNEWSRVDLAWLPPSATAYSESDSKRVKNETCCAPPVDVPRVDWATKADFGALDLGGLLRGRAPGFDPKHIGYLKRPWNVHPAGSPVCAPMRSVDGAFVILDVAIHFEPLIESRTHP